MIGPLNEIARDELGALIATDRIGECQFSFNAFKNLDYVGATKFNGTSSASANREKALSQSYRFYSNHVRFIEEFQISVRKNEPPDSDTYFRGVHDGYDQTAIIAGRYSVVSANIA